MGIRSRIEWWTGERLDYECADELGIGAFTKSVRPRRVSGYLEYARRKQRRRENTRALIKLARATGNPDLWYRYGQHRNTLGRNKFWRSLGYPNLRRAWAARRANCARRRALKVIEEAREKQRKYLEQFGYIRP